MRRRIGVLIALALTLGLLVAAAPAHAETVGARLVVDEVLDPGPMGAIVSSNLPNCSNGTVDTFASGATPIGDEGMRFRGTKIVRCASGDTLEFRYVATYLRADSPIDWGRWRVTGGTGVYAGARGGGFLIGNYFGGSGTASDNAGITDNWIGVIILD